MKSSHLPCRGKVDFYFRYHLSYCQCEKHFAGFVDTLSGGMGSISEFTRACYKTSGLEENVALAQLQTPAKLLRLIGYWNKFGWWVEVGINQVYIKYISSNITYGSLHKFSLFAHFLS